MTERSEYQDAVLILTHPTDRMADQDEIESYLEEQETYDEVFYIGNSNGWIPPHQETLRSDLPPGFEDGHYERSLEETGCWIDDDELEDIVLEYDKIGMGGAQLKYTEISIEDSQLVKREKPGCVQKARDSVEEKIAELEAETDLGIEDEVTYSKT